MVFAKLYTSKGCAVKAGETIGNSFVNHNAKKKHAAGEGFHSISIIILLHGECY